MKECPHCGSKEYYTKEYARGTVRYMHRFDGKEAENGSMYDALTFTGGKYAYCADCDKRLFKMDGDNNV